MREGGKAWQGKRSRSSGDRIPVRTTEIVLILSLRFGAFADGYLSLRILLSSVLAQNSNEITVARIDTHY